MEKGCKVRILYHHRTMGRGAEGAHIAHITKAFEALGHSVFMISPPGIDPLAKVGATPLDKSEEKVAGINRLWKALSKKAPQFVFEFCEIAYNCMAIFRIRQAVNKHHIDFIYERNAFFLFAGAIVSKWNKIPLLVEANEVVGVKRARPLMMQSLASKIEQYSFQQATAVFTVSSFLRNLIEEKNGTKVAVHVLPNAIDPAKFKQKTSRNEIRQKYHVEQKIVIGFAGWFDWWDRLDLLIDVQKQIADMGMHDVVTMFIGDGPIVDDLKKQIADLQLDDKVILTGPVEKKDVVDYIDALDIGVLAHSNEFGSPMIMFEMMALGKAVVAPALLPVTDVITDGVNGLLFEPLDMKKCCECLVTLCKDEQFRKRLGGNAEADIYKHYTWQQNAADVLASASLQNV